LPEPDVARRRVRVPPLATAHIVSSLALVVVALCPAQLVAAWFQDEQIIMGTLAHIEVQHDDEARGRAAIAAAMQELRRIDGLMSPYKDDSELSRVNREAAQRPVTIGNDVRTVIRRALTLSEQTGGAFDITFSSVGYLYDYAARRAPTAAEIATHLPAINYRYVRLGEGGHTIRFERPGVRIDLGGIAKGYAVDKAIARLQAMGIRHALVSAGGDSRLLGDKDGRPWRVGIRDPRRRDSSVAVLPLTNAAISTSGDYERYFERDGVRHHHILNPKTGSSAAGMRSVTIIGPDAITTDGLSTSVFVLGVERGMKLVESLSGVEAVMIDDRGVMHTTHGIRDLVRVGQSSERE
jgi:thiamine biosynthesis lipoprotein